MKPLLSVLLLLAGTASAQTDSLTLNDSTKTKELQKIIVSSTKRMIDVQTDKTILNVDAISAAAGENALELLRRSPGVIVDASDNIQLNGKIGVTVLIDGKNTQLSQQDLAQLLKSIEASNIKQVEIISNPSSKYDAAGNAGIINIKLKRSLTDGFNGNITGSYAQSTHARQNATGNINWRKGRWATFLNAGINNGLQYVIATNERTASTASFIQRSIEKDFFDGYSLRAGADYSPDKKNTFGFLWMLNARNTKMDNTSTSQIIQPSTDDTAIHTRSIAPFVNRRNAFNLNYNYSGKSVESSIDADYTSFSSSVDNLVANNVHDKNGIKVSSNARLNNQEVRINLYSVKADISKTVSEQTKLETGVKWMKTSTNNSLSVQNDINSQWRVDTGLTNRFQYDEDIVALYASMNGSKKKFYWKGGLRLEYSKVQGLSTDLKNAAIREPNTSYINLFPTLFLQYKFTDKHQLGFAASRRIDRPNYQDQNPFFYFLDALNSEQGNAYLKPQFTNSVELSYTYKWATSFKISYAKTTDYIEWLTYQTDKFTVQTPQNAGSRQMISFSFSSPVTFTKKWSAYVSLTPYYHYYKISLSGFGTTEMQNGGSWAFNSYVNNTIEFGKGWKGSVGGWFNFQNRATIYVSKPLGSLDIGMQKNVLKDKATIRFNLIDLLNTQQWEQKATTNNLQLNTYRKWESQNITLGFSWRFGNNKIKKARDRGELNAEMQKRIK
jgi:iron complex outermembrane recepter protein